MRQWWLTQQEPGSWWRPCSLPVRVSQHCEWEYGLWARQSGSDPTSTTYINEAWVHHLAPLSLHFCIWPNGLSSVACLRGWAEELLSLCPLGVVQNLSVQALSSIFCCSPGLSECSSSSLWWKLQHLSQTTYFFFSFDGSNDTELAPTIWLPGIFNRKTKIVFLELSPAMVLQLLAWNCQISLKHRLSAKSSSGGRDFTCNPFILPAPSPPPSNPILLGSTLYHACSAAWENKGFILTPFGGAQWCGGRLEI